MYLNQSRIMNVDNVLMEFSDGEELYIIVENVDTHNKTLSNIGFSSPFNLGDSVLPISKGSVSRYNADGTFKLLRSLPKEPYSIDRDLTFLAYGKHQMSKTVTFNYKRFQRELISAPIQELIITQDKDGNKIISSTSIIFNSANKKLIKHTINLFLEIFKECHIVDKDLISRVKTPIKKLHWNLLPKGKMPWDTLKKHLEKNTNIKSNKNYKEIYARINYLNSFEPDFMATGNGGFNDYVVLGFESKNIYILENRKPQNATYIFENNWQDLTRLTKADILKENLQKARLIHTSNWKDNIKNYII
jgi:hypothetical protein